MALSNRKLTAEDIERCGVGGGSAEIRMESPSGSPFVLKVDDDGGLMLRDGEEGATLFSTLRETSKNQCAAALLAMCSGAVGLFGPDKAEEYKYYIMDSQLYAARIQVYNATGTLMGTYDAKNITNGDGGQYTSYTASGVTNNNYSTVEKAIRRACDYPTHRLIFYRADGTEIVEPDDIFNELFTGSMEYYYTLIGSQIFKLDVNAYANNGGNVLEYMDYNSDLDLASHTTDPCEYVKIAPCVAGVDFLLNG